MAQVGIREYDGKLLLKKYFAEKINLDHLLLVTPETKLANLAKDYPWLNKGKLVVKPDQLFGKRGKHGLVLLNAGLNQAIDFIKKNMNKTVTIGKTTGQLTHFLIEPFNPHAQEYYVAIKSERDGDRIYFSPRGGVDIEENWEGVSDVLVPIDLSFPPRMELRGGLRRESLSSLVQGLDPRLRGDDKQKGGDDKREGGDDILVSFIESLFNFYRDLNFTYLELNPFIVEKGKVIPLDLVARLDDTAVFEVGEKWGDLEFPVPFGRSFSKEENFINELDSKSGSSLKLTVLNPAGRIWTMVAGGGASVIYADTICDLGHQKELANYGEYSGNPTTDETYQYAATVLDLMTRQKDAREKVLIIGGGIANFTDVAKTFQGIIRALKDYAGKLKNNKVKIYARRGGPNYEQGLKNIKAAGEELGLPIEVYGPETHMTRVVKMGL